MLLLSLFQGGLCLKLILLGDHEGGEAFLITYELLNIAGMFRFPLVSCTATSADNANLNPGVAGKLSFMTYFCKLLQGFSYQLVKLLTSIDLQFVVDT